MFGLCSKTVHSADTAVVVRCACTEGEAKGEFIRRKEEITTRWSAKVRGPRREFRQQIECIPVSGAGHRLIVCAFLCNRLQRGTWATDGCAARTWVRRRGAYAPVTP